MHHKKGYVFYKSLNLYSSKSSLLEFFEALWAANIELKLLLLTRVLALDYLIAISLICGG